MAMTTRICFAVLVSVASLLPVCGEVGASSSYTPVHPDPAAEPWRWQAFPKLTGQGLLCLAEGRDGAMWFGGAEGVLRYDGLDWTTYPRTGDELSGPVNVLLCLRDRQILAGTETGISRFEDGLWRHLFPKTGDLPWHVNSLVETPDGTVWAGTAWGALRIESGGAVLYTEEQMAAAVRRFLPGLDVVHVPPSATPIRQWPDGVGARIVEGIAPIHAVVWHLAPNGPARAAGLKVGDRIVAVDGRPAVRQVSVDGPPGTTTILTVLRGGAQVDITVDRAEVKGTFRDLPIYDVYLDRQGRIWFGVSDRLHGGELLCWDRKEPEPGGSAESGWRLFTAADGLELGWRPRILQTADGDIWAGSFDGRAGLNRFDGKSWTVVRVSDLHEGDLGPADPFSGERNSNTALLQSQDGTVWIGTRNGLIAFRKGKWERHVKPGPDQAAFVRLTLPTSILNVDVGLYALTDGVWTEYRKPRLPVPSTRIMGLAEAADGSIWLAGRGQEAVRLDYSEHRWQTFKGLNFCCELQDGSLWFVSQDDGVVSKGSGGRWTRYGQEDGLMDTPLSVLATRKGDLWAQGSHRRTAALARFENGRWHLQTYPRLSWGMDARVAYESSDGTLWFGAKGEYLEKGQVGGVLRLHNGKPTFCRRNLEVPATVYGIAQTADGAMWFGGSDLRRLDGQQWTAVLEPRELLREPWINVVYNDSQGRLWIGTRNYGVFAFDGERWTRHNVRNGLSGNTVRGIVESGNGGLWVATDKGVSRYDGHTWTTHALQPGLPLVAWDGLRRTSDGTLWINLDGTHETIRYSPDTRPPETRIDVTPGEVSKRSNTTITWTGVDLWQRTADADLQFAWKLDGGPWSPFTPDRSHTLPSLSSGAHTFQVAARDQDFNVDPTPASVAFTVTPPVWRQAWFLALMAVAIGIIALQTSRVVARGRKLRETVAQLSNANVKLREMDTAKTDFFSNVSHELRTPLTAIKGYIDNIIDGIAGDTTQQQQRYLERVKSNADRLTWHINELLDLARFESGRTHLVEIAVTKVRMSEVVAETVDSLKPTAEAAGIRLEHHCADVAAIADRNRVTQIVMNLVMNGIKFTGRGGRVTVTVGRQEDGYVRTDVEDTGVGIPSEDMERIFDRYFRTTDNRGSQPGAGLGLPISRQLVELQGGKIWVTSQVNVGSVFSFTLPVAQRT